MSGAVFTGQLRRRVMLLIPVASVDASGFLSRAYSNGPLIWAHIRPLQMAGRYGADRQEGLVTHHITCRSLSSFGAGYRFALGSRIFDVVSFQDCEGTPSFMRAYCQEIQP